MPHGIWKGTLGFGLVNIGVELFSAEQPNELDLDMLDKRDLSRIGYLKVNKSTGDVVEAKDIVKGMAVTKDHYVVLSAADLKEANPKATQSIDIVGFVEAGEIDLIYFAKPYLVMPLKGSEKAYGLLRDSLQDTGKMGLAQVVIRTRQHVSAVYPHKQALVVHLLRYADEVRDPGDLGAIGKGASSARKALPKEVSMAEQLIESMTTAWDPTEFTDSYRKDLLKLVKQRAKRGTKKSPPVAEVARESSPRVLDLMAALERSVATRGGRGKTAKKVAKSHHPARRRSA